LSAAAETERWQAPVIGATDLVQAETVTLPARITTRRHLGRAFGPGITPDRGRTE
jgi:hypothetical protein